jgi:methylmalonyl-CoA/ethylmalonyl-CoA epimerase
VPGIRFDHIAVAQHHISDLAPFLGGVLGGEPDYGAPSPEYRWGQWRFTGGSRIEVLEPAGQNGFLHRFLTRYGPGVHHVTFRVPSLDQICDRARTHGYEIVGYDASHPDWKEAFLHPKQAQGLVVQFAEATVEGSRRWQPPPRPANAPAPVTVVGLLTRAQSRERADLLWRLVLDGEPAEGAGALTYRWPGSPMRIAVEVDPDKDEGPVAIELSSPRPLTIMGRNCPDGIRFSLVDPGPQG